MYMPTLHMSCITYITAKGLRHKFGNRRLALDNSFCLLFLSPLISLQQQSSKVLNSNGAGSCKASK